MPAPTASTAPRVVGAKPVTSPQSAGPTVSPNLPVSTPERRVSRRFAVGEPLEPESPATAGLHAEAVARPAGAPPATAVTARRTEFPLPLPSPAANTGLPRAAAIRAGGPSTAAAVSRAFDPGRPQRRVNLRYRRSVRDRRYYRWSQSDGERSAPAAPGGDASGRLLRGNCDGACVDTHRPRPADIGCANRATGARKRRQREPAAIQPIGPGQCAVSAERGHPADCRDYDRPIRVATTARQR